MDDMHSVTPDDIAEDLRDDSVSVLAARAKVKRMLLSDEVNKILLWDDDRQQYKVFVFIGYEDRTDDGGNQS